MHFTLHLLVALNAMEEFFERGSLDVNYSKFHALYLMILSSHLVTLCHCPFYDGNWHVLGFMTIRSLATLIK